MPNWCTNEVTVFGKEETLQKFAEFVKAKDVYHGRCSERYEHIHNTETDKWDLKEKEVFCEQDDPYKDTCDKRQEVFCFQSIIPMPTALEGIGSPARVVDTQEEVDDWIAKHEDFIKTGMGRPITKKEHAMLLTEHKTDSWYDWCCDHWGTKWDIHDVELQDDGWVLRYDFDTAWSPPQGIYEALIEKFNGEEDFSIQWFYREDGMQMAGYLPD